MNALAPSLDLAPALVVLPGPRAAGADAAGAQAIRPPDARDLLQQGPVLVAHAAMTARRLARSFKGMIFAAAGISLLSFACGMAASYLFDLPTGASVVCASLLFLLLSLPKRAKGA